VYETGLTFDLTLGELVEKAQNAHVCNVNQQMAEGIVIRPRIPAQHPVIGQVSFKVINPDYLLKHGI